MVGLPTPHSAHSAENEWKKTVGGSESGRGMIRREKASVGGRGGKKEKKRAQVNERQREAGSFFFFFFLDIFNWLSSFSSTQLACMLHVSTRS